MMKMENSRTILHENLRTEELQRDVPLPYIVPEGYFDTIYADIINKLPKEEVLLAGIKQPYFDVPDGYFNDLSNNILASINAQQNNIEEELASIAPVFNTISKQVPYQVPEGYFENLQVDNNKSVEVAKEAKVISITKRTIWLRVAVAASVIGILFIGASIFSHKNNENYTSYTNVDLKSSVKKVSDEDLVKYLNNDYIASNNDMIILDDGDAPDVKQKIQAVPDADLSQYLQETRTSKNRKKGI